MAYIVSSVPPFRSNTSFTTPYPFYSSNVSPSYSTYYTNTTLFPNLSFTDAYSPPSSYSHLYGYENTGYSGSDMVIPIFDGTSDGYWWILCIERYFKERGTPEAAKVSEAMTALYGSAHQWWLERQHLSNVSWESFTEVFLWWFKPEYRDVLPLQEDEQDDVEEEAKSELLVESFFVQKDLVEEERDERPKESEPQQPEDMKNDKEDEELVTASPSESLRSGPPTIVRTHLQSPPVQPPYLQTLPAPSPKPLARVSISPPLLLPPDRRFRTTVEVKKFKNPVLSPPPPKPPDFPTLSFTPNSVILFLGNPFLPIPPEPKPPNPVFLWLTEPPPSKPPDPINVSSLNLSQPAQSDDNFRKRNKGLQDFLHWFTPLDLKGFCKMISQPLNKSTTFTFSDASLSAFLAVKLQQQPLDLQQLTPKQSAPFIQFTICVPCLAPTNLCHVELLFERCPLDFIVSDQPLLGAKPINGIAVNHSYFYSANSLSSTHLPHLQQLHTPYSLFPLSMQFAHKFYKTCPLILQEHSHASVLPLFQYLASIVQFFTTWRCINSIVKVKLAKWMPCEKDRLSRIQPRYYYDFGFIQIFGQMTELDFPKILTVVMTWQNRAAGCANFSLRVLYNLRLGSGHQWDPKGYFDVFTVLNSPQFKSWDPGDDLFVFTMIWSYQFKQWDPGKFVITSIFFQP